MARIVLPITFHDWILLLKAVKAKDVTDGLTSVIRPFNTEEGINMTTDESNGVLAVTAHDLSLKKEKEAEKLLKMVDHDLDPIWAKHVDRVQFGKKFYHANIHKLVDYGVDVEGETIVYPSGRDERCTCIQNLIDHHLSLAPGTSPFTAAYLTEQEMNLTNDLAALPGIGIKITAYATAKGQSETQMAVSDGLMELLVDHLMVQGQFLVGYYSVAEKANDWGFRIDHSPKDSVIRDGEVANQSTKTLNRLVTGSDLVFKGPGTAKLFKGKLAMGPSVALIKDQVFKIKYGWGTVTIQNDDLVNGFGYSGEFNP